MGRKKDAEIRIKDYVVLMVDDIPITTIHSSQRPPDIPGVPLPSEDLYMPSDDVLDTTLIEMTDNTSFLDYKLDDALFDDEYELSAVLPQGLAGGFVELEIRINYQGWVDSVIVLQNTTGEKGFSDLARKTAFRTRYVDERPGNLSLAVSDEGTPVLTAPDDGAVLSDPMLELFWEPVDGTNGYCIEIAVDNDFDSVYVTEMVQAEELSLTMTENGLYFWRVSALYAGNIKGHWSSVRAFKLNIEFLPEKPAEMAGQNYD